MKRDFSEGRSVKSEERREISVKGEELRVKREG